MRQTTPPRNALWKGYEDVFTKILDITSAASFSEQLDELGSGLKQQASLDEFAKNHAAAVRADKLAGGFLELSDAMARIEAVGDAVEVAQCMSGGALQLWVMTTLDDELVSARWKAVRTQLLDSPLGKGDLALQRAISDVDGVIGAAASGKFLDNMLDYINKVETGVTTHACVDYVAGAVAKLISKALVSILIDSAAAAGKATLTASLTASVATALAAALIEDWVTKDVFLATQNGERLAILASLLRGGKLGAFADLKSTMAVDANGIAMITVPDVLDYTDSASAPYLRLQVATYAQSSIFDTISKVVKRDDMSGLTQLFDNWKNVWCHASSSCPSGWGIELLAKSFDQASWVNENVRQKLVSTFAACAVPGACSATCDDRDRDGHGEGLLCAGSDCAPEDGSVHAECTTGGDGAGGSADGAGGSAHGSGGSAHGSGGSGTGGADAGGGGAGEGTEVGIEAQISASSAHTCALKADGSLWCWGYNEFGQVGDGTFNNNTIPMMVSALGNSVSEVSVGFQHTFARTMDGSLWQWGLLGSARSSAAPLPVHFSISGAPIAALAASGGATCARKTDGSLWCWGGNQLGQLGNGTTSDTAVVEPVQVSALGTSVAEVSTGNYHTCARKTDGSLWCWGLNSWAQLGDGTTVDRSTPVQISALGTSVVEVAVGTAHTCARKSDGSVWCWGDNRYGQLGDGTTVDQAIPVHVSSLGTAVAEVSAGQEYTCARKTDGSLWCWGLNSSGQIGDGTTNDTSTPVFVLSLVP